MFSSLVAALALSGACLAHGETAEYGQRPIVDENANWITKHMAGTRHTLIPLLRYRC